MFKLDQKIANDVLLKRPIKLKLTYSFYQKVPTIMAYWFWVKGLLIIILILKVLNFYYFVFANFFDPKFLT